MRFNITVHGLRETGARRKEQKRKQAISYSKKTHTSIVILTYLNK